MSLFARASWPGDHRDEIVAGTLVAAVIVVLGYASGMGSPVPTTVETAVPPAAKAPSESSGPADDGSQASGPGVTAQDPGAGSVGGAWPGAGDAGIPVTVGTPPAAGHEGHGGGGADTGHGPAPSPSGSATTPPSPAPSDTCDEGEVRLVRPLLSGTLDKVTGLLDDGLTGMAVPPSPLPSPSSSPSSSPSPDGPCVGVAASPSVLTGVLE
ncbi:hypothetical protein GCM10023086_06050 [Streptomyces venetus]|uniref:Uncharacterized protein n=1 Tax=Streptomyces venetus TaxID=1701086 RepID=A0ABP8F463_9ACTN